MNVKMKPVNPEKIELELTIKLPMGDWKRVREQVDSDSHPGWRFRAAINAVIDKASEHFETEDEIDV